MAASAAPVGDVRAHNGAVPHAPPGAARGRGNHKVAIRGTEPYQTAVHVRSHRLLSREPATLMHVQWTVPDGRSSGPILRSEP